MNKSALLSDCKSYRYWLRRQWDNSLPSYAFIGLNPSTADANIDDPTIRRCIGFVRDFGGGSLIMLNLFAYRATKPSNLFALPECERYGILNTDHILQQSTFVDYIIAAWGADSRIQRFGVETARRINIKREAHGKPLLAALKLTKNGAPSHPLYLSKTLRPSHYYVNSDMTGIA